MGFGNWFVVLLPVAAIIGMSIYCRRYIRDVADYLSAGRVARRYVICVGGMIDLRHLFRDLEARKRDYSDDGRVEKLDDWQGIRNPERISRPFRSHADKEYMTR